MDTFLPPFERVYRRMPETRLPKGSPNGDPMVTQTCPSKGTQKWGSHKIMVFDNNPKGRRTALWIIIETMILWGPHF